MALAERRLINFPENSTPASPSFESTYNVKSSGSSIEVNGSTGAKEVKPLTPEKSLSPMDLSPTSRSVSPDSLLHLQLKQTASASPTSTFSLTQLMTNSTTATSTLAPSPMANSPLNGNSMNNNIPVTSSNGYTKKPKLTSRAPIATGISTTIPVTGEKPRPEQKNDASLQDDVLYAIFLILYEKDPEGLGMTVKQICDTLVERHPEMATLLTKTSNLVSAKLNAYVKRVEKGDLNLKYALLRDWADASPKRMVYVYRGLLTHDFHLHVKMMAQKSGSSTATNNNINSNISNNINNINNNNNNINGVVGTSSFSDDKNDEFSKGGAFSNGLSNGFEDVNNNSSKIDGQNNNNIDSLSHSMVGKNKQRRLTMYDIGTTRHSFLDAPVDRANLFVPYSSAPVTASLSGTANENSEHDLDNELEDFEVFDEDDEEDNDNEEVEFKYFNNKAKRSKSMSYLNNKKTKILTAAAAAPRAAKLPCLHSPTAAAAAAALHAAAVKSMMTIHDENSNSSCITAPKWLSVVRSGFLTQEIGIPEDISLSDLDKLF